MGFKRSAETTYVNIVFQAYSLNTQSIFPILADRRRRQVRLSGSSADKQS